MYLCGGPHWYPPRVSTWTKWLILDTLAGNDGLSMSQIASRALSSGATLTRTIDRRVSLSLVYREVSATDRRKVLVFLSDLGQSKHSAMTTPMS